MNKVLIVDNFDSFTFNLFHLLEKQINSQVEVERVDRLDLSKLSAYTHLVLSPGPGLPDDFPQLKKIIEQCEYTHKILGVCLGHQAILQYYGAKLSNLSQVMHGRRTKLNVLEGDASILKELDMPIEVGRYHSWGVTLEDLPSCFKATALAEDNIVMAADHLELPLKGVQFHPESVLTPFGEAILKNWLDT